jgi:hypothetical protein
MYDNDWYEKNGIAKRLVFDAEKKQKGCVYETSNQIYYCKTCIGRLKNDRQNKH